MHGILARELVCDTDWTVTKRSGALVSDFLEVPDFLDSSDSGDFRVDLFFAVLGYASADKPADNHGPVRGQSLRRLRPPAHRFAERHNGAVTTNAPYQSNSTTCFHVLHTKHKDNVDTRGHSSRFTNTVIVLNVQLLKRTCQSHTVLADEGKNAK